MTGKNKKIKKIIFLMKIFDYLLQENQDAEKQIPSCIF